MTSSFAAPVAHPRSAQVSTIDGRTTTGLFQVRVLTTRDRVVAGFKWLGISWLIALIFLPFPMIHLVMVPLFVLLGPVAFVFGFRSDTRIEGGKAECPACGKQIHFPVARFKPRYKETCPECLNAVYVTFDSEPKSETETGTQI